MKNLFKLVFCFILTYTINDNVYAQKVQPDSIKPAKYINVPIKTDADLLEEITSDNQTETIILTKSTGEMHVEKPNVKEKKFISTEGKE